MWSRHIMNTRRMYLHTMSVCAVPFILCVSHILYFPLLSPPPPPPATATTTTKAMGEAVGTLLPLSQSVSEVMLHGVAAGHTASADSSHSKNNTTSY